MTLNGWQERLTEYFAKLRRQIVESGSERPIFALEHDIDDEGWIDLVKGLRDHVSFSGPAERHWLPWAVYAAEIGYKFKGDQYWQTFAADLPGWNQKGDRDFVKDALMRFRKGFSGVEPSGAWANNFTIICWPIANAILPKDLQRHLASILYDVRDMFTSSLIHDPRELGLLIEAHSEGTSKRFKQFAGQHALVGRIASALLLSGSDAGTQLLLSHTLARITHDLQTEQNSRDWLRAAKQRASSVAIHGTRSQTSSSISAPPHLQEELRQLAAKDERIELSVRQTAIDCWSFRALIPNLAPLTLGNSGYQRIVSSQRSFLNGATRNHFPPRFFLHARREVELSSLPKAGEPFMRFEDTMDGFREFLDRHCSFPTFSSLLFKLGDGGEAIRLRSRTLRQDHRYLYVSRKPLPPSIVLQSSHSAFIKCDGLHGLLIDVPAYVSSFYIEAAKSLGLEISKGIRIRPIAYPAKHWSGDGDVIWSESAPKVLCITSDAQTDGLMLNLIGSGADQALECSSVGKEPTFVDLSDLGVGDYQLHVITRISGAVNQMVTGSICIAVLPAEEVVLDTRLAQGFTVLPSISLPSLEQLWNGSATLDLYGPVGNSISCQLQFHPDMAAKQVSHKWSGGDLRLPITSDDWQTYLDRARSNKQVQTAYESSASCTVSFRSIELGETTLHCEREFVPFRWFLREKNSSYRLRLIQNDTSEKVSVARLDFDKPDVTNALAIFAEEDVPVGRLGGLFVAKRGHTTTAIVVPPAPINSLSGLGIVVNRIAPASGIEGLVRLTENIKLWTDAQLVGDFLSRSRRDAAIASLKVSLIETLCGAQWVAAESDLEHGRKGLDALSDRLGTGQDHKLSRAAATSAGQLSQVTPADIAAIALDLSSNAKNSSDHYSASRGDLIERIIRLQQILRLDDRSVETVPTLDTDCATLAVGMPTLSRIIRFLLLAKDRMRETSPVKATMEYA
jgi:hypothetical protein